MSVLFIGDGTKTSSISFTTQTLTNPPVVSTDVIPIEQNIEVITSDAGVRTVYQKGERQTSARMKFTLLTDTTINGLRDWIETIKGGSNWFTLQSHHIGVQTAIQAKTGSTSSVLINSTDLASSNWPVNPIGQWAIFITSTGLAGKRRRISDYASTAITVNPAFSATPAVDDTFVIGLPVFLTNNPTPRRILPSFWEVEFVFEELGYIN